MRSTIETCDPGPTTAGPTTARLTPTVRCLAMNAMNYVTNNAGRNGVRKKMLIRNIAAAAAAAAANVTGVTNVTTVLVRAIVIKRMMVTTMPTWCRSRLVTLYNIVYTVDDIGKSM